MTFGHFVDSVVSSWWGWYLLLVLVSEEALGHSNTNADGSEYFCLFVCLTFSELREQVNTRRHELCCQLAELIRICDKMILSDDVPAKDDTTGFADTITRLTGELMAVIAPVLERYNSMIWDMMEVRLCCVLIALHGIIPVLPIVLYSKDFFSVHCLTY